MKVLQGTTAVRGTQLSRLQAVGASLMLAVAASSAAQAATIAAPSECLSAAIDKHYAVGARIVWLDSERSQPVWMQLAPGSSDADPRWDIMVGFLSRLTSSNISFSLDDIAIQRVDSTHIAIAWPDYDKRGLNYDLYAQVFDLDFKPTSPRFSVTAGNAGSQVYPVLLPNVEGRFTAVYRGTSDTADSPDIYAQRFTVTGKPVGSEVVRVNSTAAGFQSRPAGACNAKGRCLVSWGSSDASGQPPYSVLGQYLNNDLTLLDGEFVVSAATSLSKSFPSVAMNAAGDATVAWSETQLDGTFVEIKFQRYKPNRTASGNVVSVTTAPTSLAHALINDAGKTSIAYSEINGKRARVQLREWSDTGTTLTLADTDKNLVIVEATGAALSPAGQAIVTWRDPPVSDSEPTMHLYSSLIGGQFGAACGTTHAGSPDYETTSRPTHQSGHEP